MTCVDFAEKLLHSQKHFPVRTEKISNPVQSLLTEGTLNKYANIIFWTTFSIEFWLSAISLGIVIGCIFGASTCCKKIDRRQPLKFSVISSWVLSILLVFLCGVVLLSGGLFHSVCDELKEDSRDIINTFADGHVSTDKYGSKTNLTLHGFQDKCRKQESLFEIFDVKSESVIG